MIADGVAAFGDFLGERRAAAHVFADEKKRGCRIVAVEQIQEFWCHCRIWAVVECDCNRGIAVDVADGGAEEL